MGMGLASIRLGDSERENQMKTKGCYKQQALVKKPLQPYISGPSARLTFSRYGMQTGVIPLRSTLPGPR